MPSGQINLTLGQQPAPSDSATTPGTKHYTSEQRIAVKHWAVWTSGMVLGVMLVIGIVLVILDRQRRIVLRTAERKKKTRIVTDAWAESGKRLDPDTVGSRDETVDIDPDELGPHDIGGGGDRDPHGEGPHG